MPSVRVPSRGSGWRLARRRVPGAAAGPDARFVALLRECLSGGTVTFAGDHYQIRLGVELGDRRPTIIAGRLAVSGLPDFIRAGARRQRMP
jgi:hypothetical protein